MSDAESPVMSETEWPVMSEVGLVESNGPQ